MRHFPIFVDLTGQRVVVSGAGETAVAKLRLLLKTGAVVHVFGSDPVDQVSRWARDGRVTWYPRNVGACDLLDARLVYAANDVPALDLTVKRLGQAAGVLVNVVDNLQASEFITPAIVDRDPVTVAIGTEGTAPVLARRLKADLEAQLPSTLGVLARIAAGFRKAAEHIPSGRIRRAFWSRFFDDVGPRALQQGGEAGAAASLHDLADTFASQPHDREGRVILVGAGPGDPDLLTIKAREALYDADVVLHDRLVDPRVLELVRREAVLVEVGKTAGGPSWSQDDINDTAIRHARDGHVVVRLKSGDPMVFGRADEEIEAYEAAGVPCDVIPGITAAVAAAARTRCSLTRRDRNSGVSFLTAQDLKGYAEHDWRALAAPGATAALYMGVKAARFVQGRLLLHGAAADTPVTIVENITRANELVLSGTLRDLQALMVAHAVHGPAIIFIGIAARDVPAVVPNDLPVVLNDTPTMSHPRLATGG